MADVQQLKLQLVSKVRDNESLVARLMEYERERLELYGELEELRNSTDPTYLQELQDKLEVLQHKDSSHNQQQLQFGNNQLQSLELEEKFRLLLEREEALLAGNQQLQARCDDYCELLRVSEQEKLLLKKELAGAKGKKGEAELDGRRSAMEFAAEVKCGETVLEETSEVLSEEIVESLEKALEEAKAAEVQLSAALRCLSGQVATSERENMRLEALVDDVERKHRDAERELRETQAKLKSTEALLIDSEANCGRSYVALRTLSGQVAALEGERARMDSCADAFDKERSENYRNVASLMSQLAAAGNQIIGLEDVNARLQAQSSETGTSHNPSRGVSDTYQEKELKANKPSVGLVEGHPPSSSACKINTSSKKSEAKSSHQPKFHLLNLSLLGAVAIGAAAVVASSWFLAM